MAQPHAQAAQSGGALRPSRRIAQQLRQALGIGERRNPGNGLQRHRLNLATPREEGKGIGRRVLSLEQRMGQRGDEHRLAGPLQAGNREPLRRLPDDRQKFFQGLANRLDR
jgi:hypothetical protein